MSYTKKLHGKLGRIENNGKDYSMVALGACMDENDLLKLVKEKFEDETKWQIEYEGQTGLWVVFAPSILVEKVIELAKVIDEKKKLGLDQEEGIIEVYVDRGEMHCIWMNYEIKI